MSLVDFQAGFNNDLRGQLMARAQAQFAAAKLAEEQRRTLFNEGMQEKAFASNEELKHAQLDANAQARTDATTQREREYGLKLNDQIQPGLIPDTPETARTIATLRAVGAGTDQAERPAIETGPLMPGDTGAAKPKGFLKVASANQTNVIADNERATAQSAAAAAAAKATSEHQAKVDAETGRHNRAVEGSTAETRALAGELQQLKINEATAKAAKVAKDTETAESNAKSSTENALALAQRLKTHPDLDKAYGAYEMRGMTQGAQDVKAIRDQLVAALALPNLGALKGPMSDKDVAFIKSLSTRLANPNISDPEAVRAIGEAETFLNGKLSSHGITDVTPGAPAKPSAADLIKKYGG